MWHASKKMKQEYNNNNNNINKKMNGNSTTTTSSPSTRMVRERERKEYTAMAGRWMSGFSEISATPRWHVFCGSPHQTKPLPLFSLFPGSSSRTSTNTLTHTQRKTEKERTFTQTNPFTGCILAPISSVDQPVPSSRPQTAASCWDSSSVCVCVFLFSCVALSCSSGHTVQSSQSVAISAGDFRGIYVWMHRTPRCMMT